MRSQIYIAKAGEFITFFLTAFGGFLLNITPPEETGANYAVGITSFLTLILFLFVVALTQKQLRPQHRKYWLSAAFILLVVFVSSAFIYKQNFNQLTFLYPSKPDEGEQTRYLKGTVRTPEAESEVQRNPKLETNPAELLDKFGEYSRNEVWTQESLNNASTKLLVNYIVVVLSLALTAFCLIEGVLLRSPPTSIPLPIKIKILFLAANPAGTDWLQLDEEIRAITEKIRAAAHPDLIEVISRWAVRPDDLLQALNEHKPHIVHFSGHGSDREEIILNDRDGTPKPVSKNALVKLFQTLKDNIQVVVLNACYSQSQAEAIIEQIHCAIGMNRAIGDDAAIIFAASFYRAVGFGRSVKDAFDQGITALSLEGTTEENTPKLLTQKGADPSKIVLVAPS